VPFRPARAFEARFKAFLILFSHRIDLHHLLLDACKATPARSSFLPLDGCSGAFEDLGRAPGRACGAVRSKDGRTFEAAAVIGAERARLGDARADAGGRARRTLSATFAPSHHRADGARALRACGAMMSCCGGGPGLSHRALSAAARRPCSNIVAVFRTSTYAEERRPSRGHRAEIEGGRKPIAMPQPAMKSLLAMMDSRAALGDLRSRIRSAVGTVAVWCCSGNAAHPTVQSLGGRAPAMAIEGCGLSR